MVLIQGLSDHRHKNVEIKAKSHFSNTDFSTDASIRFGYFRFLKQRFIGANVDVKLVVADKEDLKRSIEKTRLEIAKMAESPKLTTIEKAGALRMLKSISALIANN